MTGGLRILSVSCMKVVSVRRECLKRMITVAARKETRLGRLVKVAGGGETSFASMRSERAPMPHARVGRPA